MSGFDKIEFKDEKKNGSLNTPTRVQSSSSIKQPKDFAKSQTTADMPKRTKKGNFRIPKKIYITFLVIVVLAVLIAIPAYATYKSGLATYRQSKLIASALKKQNVTLASQEIVSTQKSLDDTKKNLHYLVPLKIVPILSWYYNDADHLLNAAGYGLDSAKTVADSLTPYADVLGLKGTDSTAPAGGSAGSRIKTAVLSMGKITPQIDTIEKSLVQMQQEVDGIDPNHYPEFIFGKKLKTELTTLKTVSDQSAVAVTDAKPLIKTLPSLLGESAPKKYLVIFQNDKELRPTGGFITAYAIFSIDQGIISFEKSDDIYNLDDSIPNKSKAEAPILKYFPGVYTKNLRDDNLNPDFVKSMDDFKAMYDTAGLKENVDGIIAIDSNVLVSTIKILDDNVQADGQTFTTKNDPRCDCPQVIYALENNISRPVNYVKTARKSILGDLISAIMVKALSSSPKIYWGPLFQSIIAQTNQKNVLFYLYDAQAQQGLEALNAAGQIHAFDGDYLHINEANFSGAKVNIFMQEAVDNAYKVDSDGTIEKTVTIHYKNPYPPSDCSLASGGLCLNALYRDWIRIYVPQGSELVSSTGSQVKMSTYNESGKTVFEGFLTVRTQGVATLTLNYKLPFKLKNGSPLPLLIQKQPGATNNPYQIIVNDKTVDSFNLTSDKETKVNF